MQLQVLLCKENRWMNWCSNRKTNPNLFIYWQFDDSIVSQNASAESSSDSHIRIAFCAFFANTGAVLDVPQTFVPDVNSLAPTPIVSPSHSLEQLTICNDQAPVVSQQPFSSPKNSFEYWLKKFSAGAFVILSSTWRQLLHSIWKIKFGKCTNLPTVERLNNIQISSTHLPIQTIVIKIRPISILLKAQNR